MEVVRGVVSRVILSSELKNDEDEGWRVNHTVSCHVGGRTVELSVPKMVNILNGDEVVFAGWRKHGTIIARAYRNLSNGSRGRWKYQAQMLFVTGPIIIGVSAILPFLLVFSIPTWFWWWFQAAKTFRAYRAVLASRAAPRADESDTYGFGEAEPLPLPPAPPPLPLAVAPPPPPPAAPRDVRFNCPRCGKSLRMSAANVGRRVRCSSKDCAVVIDTSGMAS